MKEKMTIDRLIDIITDAKISMVPLRPGFVIMCPADFVDLMADYKRDWSCTIPDLDESLLIDGCHIVPDPDDGIECEPRVLPRSSLRTDSRFRHMGRAGA